MKHSLCNSIDTWQYICIVFVLLTAYCTLKNDDSFVFQNIDFEIEVQPNEKQAKELVVRVIDRDLGMVGLCPCHCLTDCLCSLSFSISVSTEIWAWWVSVSLSLPVCPSFFLSVFLSSCLSVSFSDGRYVAEGLSIVTSLEYYCLVNLMC